MNSTKGWKPDPIKAEAFVESAFFETSFFVHAEYIFSLRKVVDGSVKGFSPHDELDVAAFQGGIKPSEFSERTRHEGK